MVCSAASNLRQPLRRLKIGIKLVALRLRAVILPIRRVGERKRLLQLLDERLIGLRQAAQQRLGLLGPVGAAVLLARAADALDAVHGRLCREAAQDEVDGLEEHGDGRVDLALGLVGQNALAQAILLAKVGVKVDLGLGDDGQVGLYDNCCVTVLRIEGGSDVNEILVRVANL